VLGQSGERKRRENSISKVVVENSKAIYGSGAKNLVARHHAFLMRRHLSVGNDHWSSQCQTQDFPQTQNTTYFIRT
jgi:hypothetical protein